MSAMTATDPRTSAATVEIRAFRDDDAPFAAELGAQVFSRPWSVAQYVAEAAAADRDYLVAELDGQPVGYAGAWDAPDITHVMTVAVVPHARRRGVARRLVTDLIDRSRDRGATAWTLEVRADEPGARALYDQLGFVEVGRRPDYYLDPGTDPAEGRGRRVDAVLMTRPSPPKE